MRYFTVAPLAPAALAISLLLAGCDTSRQETRATSGIAGLGEVIDLEIPAGSAQWEIFGTPEYRGGVPGPTDFVTLVAELRAVPGDWIKSNTTSVETTYIVPEAARPWLSPAFRAFLDEKKNAHADMAAHPECRRYPATMKKTAQKVNGFVCAQAGNVLLYMTLSSPQ